MGVRREFVPKHGDERWSFVCEEEIGVQFCWSKECVKEVICDKAGKIVWGPVMTGFTG